MIAWIAVLVACTEPAPPATVPSAVVPAVDATCDAPTRGLIDAWIAGDAARMKALYQPDAAYDDLMGQHDQLRAAFPDATVEIERLLVDGDRAAAMIVIEGTQDGPFLGVPATHNRVKMHLDWWTSCGGGVVHVLDQRGDLFAAFAQIGQFPPVPVK